MQTTAATAEQLSKEKTTGTKNAVDLFRQRVATSGDKVALRYKAGNVWLTLSWNDWYTASREVAAGLRALGVGVGDRVCIVASTRWEWVVSDVGILMAGAVTVPIYQSNTPEQCEYIITDSGAKVVFAEDPHQLEKLLRPEVRAQLSGVERIVLMSDVAHLEKPDSKGRRQIKFEDVLPKSHADWSWVESYAGLRSAGKQWMKEHAGELEKGWDAITPDHMFTIVYTSGTTGNPKGVVLTHKNIVFECEAIPTVLELDENDEQLLFLPLAHIFAKLLEWMSISRGVVMAFAEGIPQLVLNMQEIRPTFMGAVPRVYEKVYVKINAGLAAKEAKPIVGQLIKWALATGKAYSTEISAGRTPGMLLEIQMRIADRLVFSKIKATFGGRLRFFISGGAPLSREIAEFFHAAGVLILEGYGLTETTAATHVNRPSRFRFGTVGPAIPGVDTKIAEDGEILIRGGNIMSHYYKNPDATREVIDEEGWFHTGDVGVMEDGLLRITDRKKDLIVTAGGKNIAPQNIENSLKAGSGYVSQVMVHGDQRPFLTAIITLNEETVSAWAKGKSLAYSNFADLSGKPEVKELVQEAMNRLNGKLASYESVKKFAILSHDFTQENGELTPTLKVKRKFCSEKYKAILDGFYTN